MEKFKFWGFAPTPPELIKELKQFLEYCRRKDNDEKTKLQEEDTEDENNYEY